MICGLAEELKFVHAVTNLNLICRKC